MGKVGDTLVDFPVVVWSLLKPLTALARIHCVPGTTPGNVLGATVWH